MENVIINFVLDLLEYPKTFVKINNNKQTTGISLRNEGLDIQLNIFSDSHNRIYFEFYYDEPFGYKPDRDYPTYRAENFDVFRPLINKLVESLDTRKMDGYTPEYNNFLHELISLHRKLLKGEELPEGYQKNVVHSGINITKDFKNFSHINKKAVYDSFDCFKKNNEPLTFMKVDFSLYEDFYHEDMIHKGNCVFVPNYDIDSYPILAKIKNNEYFAMIDLSNSKNEIRNNKNNTKHYNKVTISLNDWFEKILEKPEIQQSPIKNIVLKNYLLVNLNNENNENKDNKKRVKL